MHFVYIIFTIALMRIYSIVRVINLIKYWNIKRSDIRSDGWDFFFFNEATRTPRMRNDCRPERQPVIYYIRWNRIDPGRISRVVETAEWFILSGGANASQWNIKRAREIKTTEVGQWTPSVDPFRCTDGWILSSRGILLAKNRPVSRNFVRARKYSNVYRRILRMHNKFLRN